MNMRTHTQSRRRLFARRVVPYLLTVGCLLAVAACGGSSSGGVEAGTSGAGRTSVAGGAGASSQTGGVTTTPPERAPAFSQSAAEDAASEEANIWIADQPDFPSLDPPFDASCTERLGPYDWSCNVDVIYETTADPAAHCTLVVHVHSKTDGIGWSGEATDASGCRV